MNARALTAAASTVVAVLVVAAAGLAARLELSGFGRPRDTDPRVAYLAGVVLVGAISVAVTVALYRWAGVSRWWIPVGLVVTSAAFFVVIAGLGA